MSAATVYEHEARQLKAEKLASELFACVEHAEIVTGETITSDTVLDLGAKLTDTAWAKLAGDANVNAPSPATRLLAVRMAASKIRFRDQNDDDPWAGLPS